MTFAPIPSGLAVALCLWTAPSAHAYQTGRALGPVESQAVINLFSSVPGISTPDPYLIHIRVTNVRCLIGPRACAYDVLDLPSGPLTGDAAERLIQILGPQAAFVPKISCTLSLLTQAARCWLINHD